MGIEYLIDPNDGVMYETYRGKITAEELIATVNKEHADPLFKYGMPTIADLTGASAEWDYLQINQFRCFIRGIYPNPGIRVKWAIVAPQDSERVVIKILDIMNQAVGTDIEIKIFADKQKALEWAKAK